MLSTTSKVFPLPPSVVMSPTPNFSSTLSPYVTRAPSFHSPFRKYSKPKIFNLTSEDKIYEKLAAHFKQRPSLNISNFSCRSPANLRKPSSHSRQTSHIFSHTCYTPVLQGKAKSRGKDKDKGKGKGKVGDSKLRPILVQHLVSNTALEIEGRPCSRSGRPDRLDFNCSVITGFNDAPRSRASIQVEIFEKTEKVEKQRNSKAKLFN